MLRPNLGEKKKHLYIIDFPLTRLAITAQVETPIRLPEYPGATLRGGLGTVLRKLVCATRLPECTDCLLQEPCLYARCFEPGRTGGEAEYKLIKDPPRPFVLLPITRNRELRPGDQLEFNLTLFGENPGWATYLILALRTLGRVGLGKKEGLYKLMRVEQVRAWEGGQAGNNETPPLAPHRSVETMTSSPPPLFHGEGAGGWGSAFIIYDGESDRMVAQPKPEKAGNYLQTMTPSDLVQLELETPARFKREGRLCFQPDFRAWFMHIVRRQAQLAFFYTKRTLAVDFQQLAREADNVAVVADNTHWYDWERFSTRQKQAMKLGGLVGTATYQGISANLWPYLVVGQYTHAGKGCTFGLGKYRIINQEAGDGGT